MRPKLSYLLLAICFLTRAAATGTEHVVEFHHSGSMPAVFGTYPAGLGGRDENAGVWACNFWSNFSAEAFASDLRELQLEGGNAIIVLFPFVDVRQSGPGPRNRLDQLKVIFEECEARRVAVTLRLGYAWDNGFVHDPEIRQMALLTDPTEREAWYEFCRETHQLAVKYSCFRGAFISWEDFWTYVAGATLDEPARRQWAKRIHYPQATVPARSSPAMQDYYECFDQLLADDFFPATQRCFPGLGMEVRMDDDPIYDGTVQREVFVHRRLFAAPGLRDVYFYWGPFMGAPNESEALSAREAVALLAQAMDKVHRLATPGARLILSQFNYVDNTPGFSRNSRIDPAAMSAFIRRACALLRQDNVSVYTWSNVSFYFNAINNGTFANGSEFWDFQEAIAGLDEGHPAVFVLPGGSISQPIDPETVTSANLDGNTDITVSFAAKARQATTSVVAIGDIKATVAVAAGSRWMRYRVAFPHARVTGSLSITLPDGAALKDIVVANHKQEVGSPDHVFPRTAAYADLAWTFVHGPPAPVQPEIVAGVDADGWIQEEADITAPVRNGAFRCTALVSVPDFEPAQVVQISLRADGEMHELALVPGQHSLVLSGTSDQPSVLLALAFKEHRRSPTTASDVRGLAAHLDALRE